MSLSYKRELVATREQLRQIQNALDQEAQELGRLREKVRALEARDIELERQADTADVVISELMAEIERMTERQPSMEKRLEEFQKIQDWKADQTEELAKFAEAVRQRLEYLMEKDEKNEGRISRLQEEVKALRESGQSQPAAKKRPWQPPPPWKREAAAKAASGSKILVAKTAPAARRAEPSS